MNMVKFTIALSRESRKNETPTIDEVVCALEAKGVSIINNDGRIIVANYKGTLEELRKGFPYDKTQVHIEPPIKHGDDLPLRTYGARDL